MAQPQITGNKTKALRIGQRLMVGAKSFGKGIRNSVDTSQQVITRSASKIKADQKKINTENKKQARFEDAVREETARRQKGMFSGGYKLADNSKKLVEKVLVDPMAAFWKIVAAWAIENLPTIIEELRKFVKKVRIVVASINNALRATGRLFKGLVATGMAWLRNMVTFDWGDSTGRLERAQDEVDDSYDELNASWETIYNVWGKEEEELDKMLAWLDSGKTVKETADAIIQGLPVPQTPMVGSGADNSGGGGSGISMSADEQQLTESLIAAEEGVKTKAYQDSEGIWTIGYGQTRINGRPVRPGDTITKAQALSGFRGALAEHQQRAINQLGEDRWTELDPRSRAVLTSITYNYGSIPDRILSAAKTGSAEDIAVAMNSLYGDNRGDLKGRRMREQSILRGNLQGDPGNAVRLDKDFMSGGQFAGSGTGPQVMGSGIQGAGAGMTTPGNFELTDKVSYSDFSRTSAQGGGGSVGKTSGYGQRWGRMHYGIDIGTGGQAGYGVACNVKGKVTRVSSGPAAGNFVEIVTSDNTMYRFLHLKTAFVKQGQSYNGEVIGEIGNTGRSTGIHLHFEVAPRGGGSVDPTPWLKLLTIGRIRARASSSSVSSNSRANANQLNSTAASNRTNGNKNRNQTLLLNQTTYIK